MKCLVLISDGQPTRIIWIMIASMTRMASLRPALPTNADGRRQVTAMKPWSSFLLAGNKIFATSPAFGKHTVGTNNVHGDNRPFPLQGSNLRGLPETIPQRYSTCSIIFPLDSVRFYCSSIFRGSPYCFLGQGCVVCSCILASSSVLSSVCEQSMSNGSWSRPQRACAHSLSVLETNQSSPGQRHWRNSSAPPPPRGSTSYAPVPPACAAAASAPPLLNPFDP